MKNASIVLIPMLALAGCATFQPLATTPPGASAADERLFPDGQAYARTGRFRLSDTSELPITGITVDSTAPGTTAAAIDDGDLASHWVNGGYRHASAWVAVQFASGATLANFALKTGPSPAGTSYDVQVSTDGTAWTPVLLAQTNTTWGLETKPLPSGTSGQFLRILWHNSAQSPQAHFSIFELWVNGAPSPSPLPSNSPASGPSPTPAASATLVPGPSPSASPTIAPSPQPPASPAPSAPPTPTPVPSVAPTPPPDGTASPTPQPTPGATAPTPVQLVSVPGQAVASSGSASAVADGDPTTVWSPSTSFPQSVAVPLTAAASGTLLVAWDTAAFTYMNNGAAPRHYDLLVSNDSTDGQNGRWAIAASVSDNPARSRIDTIQAPGARWVRLQVNSIWNYGPALRCLNVYAAPSASRLDSWLILGDSITAQAFDPSKPNAFAATVTGKMPAYTPALVSGGTGGDTAGNGLQKLAVALPLCPPGSFIGIAYGTNDATQGVPVDAFKAQLRQMVESILASGRTPMLARTSYDRNGNLLAYVQAIDEVTALYNLPPGPDLYGWFKAHPEQIGSDTVHPTPDGQRTIQRLWGEAVARVYGAPAM